MKNRLLSAFLLLVISIVILHNTVPHHHHEELPVIKHDDACNTREHHAGGGHQPVTCRLNSISFKVPRAPEIRPEVTVLKGLPTDLMMADLNVSNIGKKSCKVPVRQVPVSLSPPHLCRLAGRAPPAIPTFV